MAEQEPQQPVDLVEVSGEPLDLLRYTRWVSDPGAGAISTFSGVTRNSFQGKVVLRLEYEAYVPMALKELKALASEARSRWALTKVALAHRTGVVGVEEPSVILAASSPHRRESLEAVAWLIDELKARVPIWKKEFFEDGSVWKENAESRRLLLAKHEHAAQ